jgi:hypothetical protein
MRPIHIVFIVLIITLGVTVPGIISEVNRPQLTDPVAQRIWAATHGDVCLDEQESSKLVQQATLADSVLQTKKK